MFLLDTNVVSELRKGARADEGVRSFFLEQADGDRLHLPVQTIGELRCGVERIRARGDGTQAERLEAWLDALVRTYGDRILGFDADCAQVWGKLMAAGPQHPVDKQIAAVALVHDLVFVTRNVADVATTGVRTLNPFRG